MLNVLQPHSMTEAEEAVLNEFDFLRSDAYVMPRKGATTTAAASTRTSSGDSNDAQWGMSDQAMQKMNEYKYVAWSILCSLHFHF
jgi:hypothetical protein